MKTACLMMTLCVAVFLWASPVTAYAKGGPEWEGLDPGGNHHPEPTIEPGEGFTEEGNLRTRDPFYDGHQQAVCTVQTSGGSTFTSSLTTTSPQTRTRNNMKPTFQRGGRRPICWPLWRRPGRNCPSVTRAESAWRGRSTWIARSAPPI